MLLPYETGKAEQIKPKASGRKEKIKKKGAEIHEIENREK